MPPPRSEAPCGVPNSAAGNEPPLEVLLGDPRLKNGLTYYPGVVITGQTVLVSNVVRLRLEADAGEGYSGFGYLKGLWLWRDQPYIRVQYLAPVRSDLPPDAICHHAKPEPGVSELLVTNMVGDLPLSALEGAVNIETGPIRRQLYQHNLDSKAARYSCTRHLDLDTQRVQLLDDAFSLTPLVVQFGAGALQTLAGQDAAPRAPPAEQPASPPVPTSQRRPSKASASEKAPAPRAPPAKPPAKHVAAAPSPSKPTADLVPKPSSPAAPATPTPKKHVAADSVGSSASAATAPSKLPVEILQVTLVLPLRGRSEYVRYPGTLAALRKQLAGLFELHPDTVVLQHEASPKRWQAIKSAARMDELVAAWSARKNEALLELRLRGEPQLRLLSFLVALVGLANQAVALWFAALVLMPLAPPLSSAEALGSIWTYFSAVPLLALLYNLCACARCIGSEYMTNAPFRKHLDQLDGDGPLLVVASLLGPDVALLTCQARLPGVKASISQRGAMHFLSWSLALHALLDVPMLAANLLAHGRESLEWDQLSSAALGLTLVSLTFSLAWQGMQFAALFRRIAAERKQARVAAEAEANKVEADFKEKLRHLREEEQARAAA